MLIFITGKSGSGKSTFAKELASTLGFNYVDVDKIGHSIYEDTNLIDELSKLFDTNLYNENGIFDRKLLGKLLFSEQNKSKIETFNNLTWKHMKDILQPYLNQNSVIDYLMLPLTDIWNLKAIKLLVKTHNEDMRISKILKRDKITKEYLMLRESKAPDFNDYDFDFILINDYTDNFFIQQDKIIEEVKKRIKNGIIRKTI